jgi:ABC-type polysaccharide/polyol phosphate transport system ATPase subunit
MKNILVKNASLSFPILSLSDRSVRNSLIKNFKSSGMNSNIAIDNKQNCVVNAINNVSFSIENGERVGLIGGNGAGKTTLIKMLSGIYRDFSGEVKINGNVNSIISLGAGMIEWASGYENIKLLSLLEGVKMKDIQKEIDQIAEFSGLGEYLALPISTYSSGMKLKLMFSVATGFNSDILVIDEFFGAGDASFYKKAEKRMTTLMHDSNILIMASHSDALLESFCERGIVMHQGSIVFDGEIGQALDHYHKNI